MTLPKKPNPPITDPSQYTTMVYGQPKIGKTTFASHATKPLFLATEPGTKALEVYDVQIRDWDTLLTTLGEVAKGDHDFKEIVVDTVDNAYEFCKAAVCAENGWDDPADAGYGKGFNAVNGEFKRVMLKLVSLPYGVMLLSHAKEKIVETRTGDYTRIVPTMPDGAAKIVKGLVDVMLYCDLQASKGEGGTEYTRIIRTRPTLNYDAGCRFPGLPEVLPLDHAEYIKAFHKAAKTNKGGK